MEDLEVNFRDQFYRTVPTLSNNDVAHAAPMRLDYILASPSVADRCVASNIDINQNTDEISDHYPVVAQFCFN